MYLLTSLDSGTYHLTAVTEQLMPPFLICKSFIILVNWIMRNANISFIWKIIARILSNIVDS